MKVDDFLTLLKDVKATGHNKFMALCPNHDDHSHSLSIKLEDQKILLNCLAGCLTKDVVNALGLGMKDLFLIAHQSKWSQREIDAIYKYSGTKGEPFEVVRFKPKSFAQRRPDGKGGYIWNLTGIVPTLYHQDDITSAVANESLIYIVEGEKDCDNLWKIGLIATTSPMGAGKWRDNYSDTLCQADIVIIPDNDGPGYQHALQVASSCYGKAKKIRILRLPSEFRDISHWLDNGGSIEQLEKLLANCQDYEPSPDTALPSVVITERHLRDISADALEALYKVNKPEHIFRRNSTLTRISLDEEHRPYTETLSESAFRGCLARSCNFMRSSSKNGAIAISPPLDVVRDCLSLGEWRFPSLMGITEAPVVRPDGTVMNTPGYDSLTRLYYYPSPTLSVPPIPDEPTDEDIRASIELVLEPLADFPFDGDASLANAIATMLTPILRPMIDGPVPLALFDKPQQGTGASLLAEVISIIATGRAAAMMTAQKDDEGWRKSITSLLLKGQLVATIDNVEYDLWAPSLAAILTATTYQDRILGKSEMVQLPNRTTWLATGNNIRLRGDLPRRCIWIRMDARMARPWLRDRTKFKHPNLPDWVANNRGAILAAILTIARAWVRASKPESQEVPLLGGYESYCSIIGGVLSYIGVKGFLGNLETMYNEADSETPQWQSFLEGWREFVGEEPATVAEVIGKLNEIMDFKALLPDSLAGKDNRDYSRRLGNALSRKNGVRFPDGLAIEKAGTRKRAVAWKVVSYGVSYEDGTPIAELDTKK